MDRQARSGRGKSPRITSSGKSVQKYTNWVFWKQHPAFVPTELQRVWNRSGGGHRMKGQKNMHALKPAWSASEVENMLISSRSAVNRHICSQPIRRRRSRSRRITPRRETGKGKSSLRPLVSSRLDQQLSNIAAPPPTQSTSF